MGAGHGEVGRVGHEVGDPLVELPVDRFALVGLRDQRRAAAGGAVHGEVDARVAHGADDLVLDLVLRAKRPGHRAVGSREHVLDLPHRVLRPSRSPVPKAPEAAGGRNGVVLDHPLQHAGVVGVDPERQPLPSRCGLQRRRLRGRQQLEVGGQPGRALVALGQPEVVHAPVRLDDRGKDPGQGVVAGKPGRVVVGGRLRGRGRARRADPQRRRHRQASHARKARAAALQDRRQEAQQRKEAAGEEEPRQGVSGRLLGAPEEGLGEEGVDGSPRKDADRRRRRVGGPLHGQESRTEVEDVERHQGDQAEGQEPLEAVATHRGVQPGQRLGVASGQAPHGVPSQAPGQGERPVRAQIGGDGVVQRPPRQAEDGAAGQGEDRARNRQRGGGRRRPR